MNAKGGTLRPSPAWEALLPGSSLGSGCMENLGGDPRTARPLLLADELSPAMVLRCKPVHHGVSERTRVPPRSACALGLAPRTTRVKQSRRVVSWCPSLRWRGESGLDWRLAGCLQSKPRRQ